MQIHVARPPTQLGVFSPEEVAEGLRTGRFLPTDQGWREGMASWSPLGQWEEFRAIEAQQGTASVVTSAAAPLSGETALPWEQGRSVAAVWKSWLALIHSPAQTLAFAKLEFGSTLLLAWAIASAFSVLALIGGMVYAQQLADAMKQSGESILQAADKINGPMAEAFRALGIYLANTQPKGFGGVLGQTLFFLAITPFLHLVYGLLQWLALRLLGLFGAQSCKAASLGRTATAVMLAMAVGDICFMVVVLFPPGGFQSALTFIVLLPFMVIYSRIVGGAVKVNPWFVFGSAVLFYCVFVACFACLAGALVGALLAR